MEQTTKEFALSTLAESAKEFVDHPKCLKATQKMGILGFNLIDKKKKLSRGS